MGSHRGSGRVRVWGGCWVVAAVAGLGAAPPAVPAAPEPPDIWHAVRTSLPPVSPAPDATPAKPAPAPGGVVTVSKRGPEIPAPAPAPDVAVPAPLPTRPPAAPAAPAVPVPAPAPERPPVAPLIIPSTPSVPAAPAAPFAPAAPAIDASALIASPNARVYVINGVDPFGWGGLHAMADRLRDSGYPDTRFGAWYQSFRFEREIRQIHRQDPGTQVVIIGYSFGVYRAKSIASRLNRDGIPVAMVGYVGGDYLRNSGASVPGGGTRVVNVTGNGYLLTGRNLLFNGTDLTGATNMRLGVKHFDLPKQEQTFDTLLTGMNAATGRATTGVAYGPEGFSPARAAAMPADTVSPPRTESNASTRPARLLGRIVDR
jgi:hypothetical protein